MEIRSKKYKTNCIPCLHSILLLILLMSFSCVNELANCLIGLLMMLKTGLSVRLLLSRLYRLNVVGVD